MIRGFRSRLQGGGEFLMLPSTGEKNQTIIQKIIKKTTISANNILRGPSHENNDVQTETKVCQKIIGG
jgi:hypothetical protein